MPTRANGSLKPRTVSAPEPSAIFKAIKAQPPLLRSRVSRSYCGMEADWALTFADAHEGHPGEALVYFSAEPLGMRLVRGSVTLRKYPQLRRLHAGAPVRVRGRIQKADAFSLELEIRDLVFARAVEAAH